jgi:hypothetical protein
MKNLPLVDDGLDGLRCVRAACIVLPAGELLRAGRRSPAPRWPLGACAELPYHEAFGELRWSTTSERTTIYAS